MNGSDQGKALMGAVTPVVLWIDLSPRCQAPKGLRSACCGVTTRLACLKPPFTAVWLIEFGGHVEPLACARAFLRLVWHSEEAALNTLISKYWALA